MMIASKAKILLRFMEEIREENRPTFLHKERIIDYMISQCVKSKHRTRGPKHWVIKHLIKIIKFEQ